MAIFIVGFEVSSVAINTRWGVAVINLPGAFSSNHTTSRAANVDGDPVITIHNNSSDGCHVLHMPVLTNITTNTL